MILTLGLLTFATPARGFQDVLLLGCERDAFGGAHLPDVPVELAALEKVWKTAGRVVRSQLVSAASADTSPKTWNHFRTIHLACHGSFPEDQPLDAALRLGGTSVRASELFGVRIDADVMSLSACWVGRTSGADEGIGLQLPLIFAGVGRLVASSWPANSALAQRFMTTFHEQLAKGTAVDRAFQQAILPMLKKSPLHWGNWHLTGLPDTSTM